MRKLHALTAAAGILLALAGPTLAAQRAHRADDAYASGTADRSGAYYYGPQGAAQARAQDQSRVQDRGFVQPQERYSTGQSLPYADRPYGDPDGW
jgi:hypothetical protein